MIALVLNIVFFVGFFHIIRAAQVKVRNMVAVALYDNRWFFWRHLILYCWGWVVFL